MRCLGKWLDRPTVEDPAHQRGLEVEAKSGSSITVTHLLASFDGLPLLLVPPVGVHSFFLANGILEISYGRGNRQQETRCQ